jgi:hypothetical protein
MMNGLRTIYFPGKLGLLFIHIMTLPGSVPVPAGIRTDNFYEK